MRLHDALGERVAALALYARCEAVLRDELQLEPLPETKLLAERIGAHRSPSALAPPAEHSAAIEIAGFGTRDDLSAVPLVARERELAQIAALPQAVVLIEGEAGVGKSRLALEASRRAVGQPHGKPTPIGIPAVVVRFTEMSSS